MSGDDLARRQTIQELATIRRTDTTTIPDLERAVARVHTALESLRAIARLRRLLGGEP